MCPEFSLKKQSGAGLPVAIFVITVLALLVVVMAQLQQGSAEAVSLQIQSQRALFSAESGAQVGVREVLDANDCSGLTSPKTFASAGLAGCQAVVSCESVLADLQGSGSPQPVFTLTSAAQCGAGLDQARRVVEVKVR
ncbi:hypothetical protein LPB19_06520 [Marinobacter salinisoli]|uniref:MSHA biogenesis protein MshP n=1 Tax=Marinobacter salinisoli TaxID=2769486 RepID=A0ABX7MUH8_9GAMM|nr:hypothetical protein [Marinobacter salinisoli]QSP96037.1 hypothetical protein LPB19_06520 [Marinobacter salinisoli]